MKNICSGGCQDDSIIKKSKKIISKFSNLSSVVDYLKLLANDTRLKIVIILFEGRLCVCEIASSLELSLPAVSQQLKFLRQAGILKQEASGKIIYYSISDSKIKIYLKKLINEVGVNLIKH